MLTENADEFDVLVYLPRLIRRNLAENKLKYLSSDVSWDELQERVMSSPGFVEVTEEYWQHYFEAGAGGLMLTSIHCIQTGRIYEFGSCADDAMFAFESQGKHYALRESNLDDDNLLAIYYRWQSEELFL